MSNREYAGKNVMNSLSAGLFGDIAASVAGWAGGIAAFRICNGVQITAGLVDGVSDIVLAFTTEGIGNFVKDFFKSVVKGAAFSAIMISVTSVVASIAPMAASWMVGNLKDVFLGKNGGFALYSGAQNIMMANLQMSTGKFADEKNAVEVFALTKEKEREWAEYERNTKDPFDTTSKYTFLGSIVNSMIPIANSSGSLIRTVIAPVASLAKDSAISIISSSTKAANEIDEFRGSLASEENCPYLKSVGIAGDAMCNKYVGAYVDSIKNEDPDEIYQNMVSYDSFDGEYADGNPKIKESSDYAKYIIACVTNDAQPGTMNGKVEGYIEGIQNNITGGNVVANGLVNFAANFVPFEGFIDSFDAAEQIDNFVWNSGQVCTGKTSDAELNKKVKDFSMYNLDQRVLYDMDLVENNSTVSFLEDYYEENPLDNSYEGKIARFSGLSKEEVSDALALIDYYNYVANYKPNERYAFGKPVVEKEKEMKFDNSNRLAGNLVILLNQISYSDVRNRSFAV